MQNAMRAAVITRPGSPEVLEIHERPTPVPGDDEALVRVHASAINRADLLQREGKYPAPPGAPSDIPGLEFAGEIVQLGAHVTEWVIGDPVFGIVGGGGNAEFVTSDAKSLARIPANLSWTDAAAVPEAFITAHDALVTQAAARGDERILIHAVGSGVGLAAAQLARALGATVLGTARTQAKLTGAEAFGVQYGILVCEDVGIVAREVERITGGAGIGVTLDLLGGPYLDSAIRVAAPRGRIMLIGTVAGRTSEISTGMVLGKRLTLRGTVLRARPLDEKRAATAAFSRDVMPLLETRVVVPVVDRVFPLSEIRRAHERVASNQTFGKVVLTMD